MNKDEFIEYLQHPEKLNAESVTDLNGLIGEFPYCQSARILLTVNLFKEKNVRYDSELKTTAVYVSNRGLLRKHIERQNTENIKVFLPDDDVDKQNESKQKTEEKTKTDSEIKPKTEEPKIKVENEATSFAEVKNIINRHIHELEVENELKLKNKSGTKKASKSVKAKNELIDEFIQKEPSISRPKTQFFDPVNKAKESVVDNENIVSETLANILYDQGHLQKAIKIYQKLSLKFPEKSIYFAALIKKAEKELES
ncbi:MAG: hypothetical protein H8E34_04860 [Bacteroidetes bacterium]|nr:hypothetical protein [Bacteroidota bacterium]MBL6944761.1 hypothetical protein [Bacteroidales bacterium]